MDTSTKHDYHNHNKHTHINRRKKILIKKEESLAGLMKTAQEYCLKPCGEEEGE